MYWEMLKGDYDWCVSLCCSQCNVQWCACTKCTNCRFKHITNQESHTKHHTKYHNGKKRKTPDINNEEVTVDDNEELTYSVMPDAHHADSQPKFSTKVGMCGGANTSLDYSVYGNPNSANFFARQLADIQSGVSSIVARSQFGVASMADVLSPCDISAQLHLSQFIYSLTRSQRVQFASCMQRFNVSREERLRNSTRQTHDSSIGCVMPHSYTAIRSMYTEGIDAIIPNLPHPVVSSIAGHSYMSLKQIVAHYLAFATSGDAIIWDEYRRDPFVTSLHNSAKAQQIFDEAQTINNGTPTIPLMFTKWSDDFEPNSQAKQNRGSAWCCTVTFYAAVSSKECNTYIISLGEKDLDHEPIEAEFNKELQELSIGGLKLYHGGLNSMVYCNVALLAVLKDQPERRKGCMIALGNSRYTA